MLASRDSDERLLEALHLKRKGLTWPQIAERLGYKSHVALQSAGLAIKAADLAEETDVPESVIRSAYW
jgi:hypothetical protein